MKMCISDVGGPESHLVGKPYLCLICGLGYRPEVELKNWK